MKFVPDAIHHTDTSESLEYITGWNDCRAAMLEQPPQRTWIGLTKQEFLVCVDGLEDLEDCWTAIDAALRSKNEM